MWGVDESAPHILPGEGDLWDQIFYRVGVQRFGGGHQFGCCVFAGRGFDTFCFFLGLTSSLPRDYCLFGLRLLRPGRFLVAFTIDFWGASVTGWREGLGIEVGMELSLTTRPHWRRDCTPRRAPTARHMARPGELSDQQVGLWRRSFGSARASALQEPLSFLSN